MRHEVVIAGAESTGKTTLAKDLVRHYRKLGGAFAKTQWVPEYGRDYTIKLIEEQGLLEDQPDAEVRSAEWGASRTSRSSPASSSAWRMRRPHPGSPLMIADTDAPGDPALGERRYLGPDCTPRATRVPVIPPRALWLLADYRDVPFTQDGIRDE